MEAKGPKVKRSHTHGTKKSRAREVSLSSGTDLCICIAAEYQGPGQHNDSGFQTESSSDTNSYLFKIRDPNLFPGPRIIRPKYKYSI